MAVTEMDIEMYAARVRVHFPPELRDTAFGLAFSIARVIGPKAKELRPETTFDEVIEWLGPQYVSGKDSLDKVEAVIAAEEDLGAAFVLPDELAAQSGMLTFADLVRHVHSERHSV